MTRPQLSLQKLRGHFPSHIFERGERYQKGGEVLDLTLRGATLLAGVQGSEYQPYRIVVQLSDDDMMSAECSCPYSENYGDYCKHIAAVVLEYYHRPDTVISEASVDDLLEPLDEATLRGALAHLLKLYPKQIDVLELYLQKRTLKTSTPTQETAPKDATSSTEESPTPASTLDTRLFEKMMRNAVGMAGYDWDGFPEYGEVYGVIEEVKPFLERGSYRDALELTKALIDTFIETVNKSPINEYENIGFSDEGIFDAFDACLAEAVFGSNLTLAERKSLLYEVLAWNDQIGNDWTSPSLAMAAHALAEGLSADDAEAEELASEVTDLRLYGNTYQEIRLRVLRATGRLEEGLEFARATAQGAGYLLILLDQNKVLQIMNEYRDQLKNDADALATAKLLAEQQPQEALELARYGLSLEPAEKVGPVIEYGLTRNEGLELATFTKDLASRLDDYKATLDAGLKEFELEASTPRYHWLRDLVGEDWDAVRAKLLDILRRADHGNRHAAADIFLNEGLFADAVNIASSSYGDSDLLRRVMGAVINTHAAWVISAACKQAEPIMDGGRSNHYDEAAAWLGYVKQAHLASGGEDEWQAYIGEVRLQHKRKYKLMGELEVL